MKIDFKRLALIIFAIVLFIYALIYITNVKGYLTAFSNPVFGYIFIYVSAFSNFAIASSIVSNKQVKLICFYGGIIWLLLALVSLFYQISNGSPGMFSQYFLQFITALGFDAAIFYISATSEN